MKVLLVVGGIAVLLLLFKHGGPHGAASFGYPMYGGFADEGKFLQ